MNEQQVLSEENYQAQMEQKVVPFLKNHKIEEYLEREPGKKIYCVRYQAAKPKGIILISHGFTETAEKYQEMIYYFVQAGYDTCIIEHCGHGRSYRMSQDLSLVNIDHYERYVEDLLFAARHAKKQNPKLPLYLYGHSMGGGIGAAAAAREPEQFQKLILSSPMIRPSTGQVPWYLTRAIADGCCRIGKSSGYVIGQHAYEPGETFETSAATSRCRFAYYQQFREKEPLFQMNGASYAWLREAGKLNHYLRRKAWKQIQAPVLLFQAEQDDFVSNQEQERFVDRLNQRAQTKKQEPAARLVRMPGTKHEIYLSHSDVLTLYLAEIRKFLE
jgi:lysophospholipase